MFEKTFALKDRFKIDGGRTAVYPTIDERVVLVIFLKKVDWPNRASEEVFRCEGCGGFIFSRGIVRARGKDYKHVRNKGGPRPAPEAQGKGPGEEKEVGDDTVAVPDG